MKNKQTRKPKQSKPEPAGLPTRSEGLAAQSVNPQQQAIEDAQRIAAQQQDTAQQQQDTAQQDTAQNTEASAEHLDSAAASKINATTLGRIAQDIRYTETENEKQAILAIQARRYHTSVDALRSVVTPYLHKVIEDGKLATRLLMLAEVQDAAFEALRYDNALLALDASKLNAAQLRSFVADMRKAKQSLASLLHSNKGTTSAIQGYAYFVHSPIKNILTDADLDSAEFYLVSTGWDGKRSYPYYGVRMTPSDNPKNTKAIQYERPNPEAILDALKPKPEA